MRRGQSQELRRGEMHVHTVPLRLFRVPPTFNHMLTLFNE